MLVGAGNKILFDRATTDRNTEKAAEDNANIAKELQDAVQSRGAVLAICPNCKARVSVDAKFCPFCTIEFESSSAPLGTSGVAEGETLRETRITCSHCGGQMPENAIVCPHCGVRRET